MRYLEPAPHMALAKYYVAHGNRIAGFFILESARRGLFEEKVFNAAFFRDFEGFDNSKAAATRLLSEHERDPNSIETVFSLADLYISRDDFVNAKRFLRLGMEKKPEDHRFTSGLAEILDREGKEKEARELQDAYLRKFPETLDGFTFRAEKIIETRPLEAQQLLTEALKRFPGDGRLLFDLGILYQKESYQKAEEAYVKAAELAPKSELVQLWVGRFFYKAKKDERRALEYYLNAYFIDPHAYETEYAEYRIRAIVQKLAAEEFAKQTSAGVSLLNLLNHANLTVVEMALERMSEEWSPAYVDPLVKLMGHDGAGVRWTATEILKEKVDGSFDERLKALLKDEDLRKRGLAAYIAAYRWKNNSFKFLKPLLSDEAQLVRFDAVSALMIDGGPAGRQLAVAHAADEPNPVLKKMILAKPEPE
jgi:tetratricopeptide (TPR) repeat protein